MKVTSADAKATVIRYFTIDEDHPVVPFAYARPPRDVQVESGKITYTYAPERQRWAVRHITDLSVTGAVLKKDGTPGMQRHTRWPEAATTLIRPDEITLAAGWKWLQSIADQLRPGTDLSMIALARHEIKEK